MTAPAASTVEHPAERGSAPPDPAGEAARAEARARLERWRPVAARQRAADRRLGATRVAVFFVGVALAIWLFKSHPAWAPLAAAPFVLFAALVLHHERVRRLRREAEAAVAHHERTLERLADRWIGVGATGEAHAPSGHLYAHDLDVVGPGSLFQLLVPPRTAVGEAALARWLLEPAVPAEVTERQAAVAELAPDVDLREQLGCLEESVTATLDADALGAWAGAQPVGFRPWERWLSLACGALAVLLTGAWLAGLASWKVLLLALLVDALPASVTAARVFSISQRSEQVAGALRALGKVLAPLETRDPTSPRLRALRDRLRLGERLPSVSLERVDRRAERLVNSLRGSVYAFFAYLYQRHLPVADALERERAELAPHVPGWIEVAGELQALASLAGHAFEHPDHVFPELVDGPARFEADDLGHPLLPATQCVRNDVRLSAERPLVVVSGSNMSGKSTYLRAVGLAAVMAQAGAPVRATRCRLSPLGVATSLRIADDLLSGTSHFYAEIRRLADIDALAGGPRPQLVLLDEILHGTNSADRFAGARAVVARLLEQGALGLVTTHDLALAKLADEHGERVRNVHFEDTITDGRMTFDYRVRDGVVERGNALELMRSLGLPV